MNTTKSITITLPDIANDSKGTPFVHVLDHTVTIDPGKYAELNIVAINTPGDILKYFTRLV